MKNSFEVRGRCDAMRGGDVSGKHLVTGASGFVGSHVVRYLLARHEEVAAFDINDDAARPRQVRFILADIFDRRALRTALRGVSVLHHHVDLPPGTRRSELERVIVNGSRVAAEEAALAGVRRFVLMSSSAVYGRPQACPVGLSTPLAPIEPYGIAKLRAEQEVEEVCKREGLPLLIVRSSAVLGRGRLGAFQALFELIRQGRVVYVAGSCDQRLQWVHVEDLVGAYSLATRLGKTGVLNVGAAEFGTLRSAIEALAAHARSNSRVRSLPEGPTCIGLSVLKALGLSPISAAQYRLSQQEFHFEPEQVASLGWSPVYSNDAMLKEAYDWYVDQLSSPMGSRSPQRQAFHAGALGVVRWLS